MNIISSYDNGNTHVTLYDDGSKERIYNGMAKPLFPESLDVKITNKCDLACSWCHEKSTLHGNHADLARLTEVLCKLPASVEIALGGGNALSHPGLIAFLKDMSEHGLISNITVNQKHVKPYNKIIEFLIDNQMIYGLGISYTNKLLLQDINPIINKTNHIVFHLIVGVNTINDIQDIYTYCKDNNKSCKVLILGYKDYGFGSKYLLRNNTIESNKYSWYTKLARFFKYDNMVIAFDNLAIDQLNLKRYFTDSAWDTFYMGKEFTHSMYVDGVDQMFAPCSTSDDRVSFNTIDLIEYFQKNRNSI